MNSRTLLTPFTSPRHCLMFAGVAMVVMGIAQWFYPELSQLLRRDSFEYLIFHPNRSALYPAFLDLFGDDFLYENQPVLALIGTTQTTIYIVAMGFMMWGLATARLPISALVLFLLALVVNYQLHRHHPDILTESLGLSMVCFLIGTLALWFHTRNYWWLAGAMLVATIAFGLRPNTIALPIGVSIIVLFHMVHTGHWKKPLLAIFVPFILVAGFEHAYFYAQHESRSGEILQRHIFGRGALVLAIHEADGQDDRFYQGEFAPLKPFMHRFGELFRADRNRYWASGDTCAWVEIHKRYEQSIYVNVEHERQNAPSTNWAWQVFSAYPMALARVIAQHYVNFFCVSSIALAKSPFANSEMIHWQSHPNHSSNRLFLQLVAWAFIALGIAFFASKIWYGTRWAKRFSALVSHRWQAPVLTAHEALGSTLIMLAFGYNLFIAIFSVAVTRFLVISFPLIVLGILLMAVVIAQQHLTKPTPS